MSKVVSLTARKLTAVTADELRNKSRGEFVYASLRDAIWEGRFAPNERIPEEEIARTLGVSRTPVREALRRLQERGLLTVGAGRSLLALEGVARHRGCLQDEAARFGLIVVIPKPVSSLNVRTSEPLTRASTRRSPWCSFMGTATAAGGALVWPGAGVTAAPLERKAAARLTKFLQLLRGTM